MHARKTKEWRYSSTHSYPCHYLKASGQFNAMAALPQSESPHNTQCIGDSMGCTAGLGILLPLLGIKPRFLSHSAHSLVERCWTYGMQDSLLSQLSYFDCVTIVSILLTVCVYIHISDRVETEHELLMLANNTASGLSLHFISFHLFSCSIDLIQI
jgi:hypothetical protein